MRLHEVRVHPSRDRLPRTDQLAWKIAGAAVDPVPVDQDVSEMIVNRVIDNASVAVAALNRPPVISARDMARAHRSPFGGSLFGLPADFRVSPEWAAWANGTAVRELDFHDTFLAADYSHPGDNIPPILAVAQTMNRSGADLLRALATGYEIHIDLVRAICLHEFRKDHIAHLAPAQAAGLGTLLNLPQDVIYQAVQQAVHVSFSTRQSRKGEISSWKAFAPAHAGKLAVEAVDRCLRGEAAPSPIYEGEDSVIAWMLAGPAAVYQVALPEAGEPKRAILDSYTKAHSAEYQSQALIDLAFRMRAKIPDFEAIQSIVIHTSHHTHHVIGSGSLDPQKYDPEVSRETLDHSIMYIFAVALQDGRWHHLDSYTPARAHRADTVRLWRTITTLEDPEWTRRYHAVDPSEKAFGGRVVITFLDGSSLVDEIAVANAHPLGAKPFLRADYLHKFETLTDGLLDPAEAARFLDAAQNLPDLPSGELHQLNLAVPAGRLDRGRPGLFEGPNP